MKSKQEKPGHKSKSGSSRVGPGASSPPELQSPKSETDGDLNMLTRQTALARRGGSDGTKGTYPNDLQPWKPPMLFQFCKVCVPA